MLNVNIVVDSNMCTGCCECIGACAANNICIMMSKTVGHPVPFIADEDCSQCGDCLKACPQNSLMNQNLA